MFTIGQEGLFFMMLYHIWRFVTWGFVGIILSVITSFLALWSLAIVLINFRVIRYLIYSHYLFLKFTSYTMILSHLNFLKHYIIMVKFHANKWDSYFWIIAILLIVVVVFGGLFIVDVFTEIAKRRYETI